MVTYNTTSLAEGNLGYPGSASSNQGSDQEPPVSMHPLTSSSTSSLASNQRYNINQNFTMYNNHQNDQIINNPAYVHHHNGYVNPSQSFDIFPPSNFLHHQHSLAQQSPAMYHPNSVYPEYHNLYTPSNLVPSSVHQHSQQNNNNNNNNNNNVSLFGHAPISAASPSISGRTTSSDVSNSPGILSESVSPINMQQVSPTMQQSLSMEDEQLRNHLQRSMPSYSQQQHPQFDWMKKNNAQAHPNPGKTRTKDKYRVVYTDTQRTHLEREFMFNNKYINIKRKCELAEVLGLSERQVKIWFQNRRAKDRKQSKRAADEKRAHLYTNNINNGMLGQPLSLPEKFDNQGII